GLLTGLVAVLDPAGAGQGNTQPVPGQGHGRPVTQSGVVRDSRAQMLDSHLGMPQGQLGHTQSVFNRPETRHRRTGSDRQPGIGTQQIISLPSQLPESGTRDKPPPPNTANAAPASLRRPAAAAATATAERYE